MYAGHSIREIQCHDKTNPLPRHCYHANIEATMTLSGKNQYKIKQEEDQTEEL